jgi:hypothetical protein
MAVFVTLIGHLPRARLRDARSWRKKWRQNKEIQRRHESKYAASASGQTGKSGMVPHA